MKNISQLRAIGYAQRQRDQKKRVAYMDVNALWEEFRASKYKCVWTYLRYEKKVCWLDIERVWNALGKNEKQKY